MTGRVMRLLGSSVRVSAAGEETQPRGEVAAACCHGVRVGVEEMRSGVWCPSYWQ